MIKQEAIVKHRRLWHWIALESMRAKKKVMKEDYFRTIIISAYDMPTSLCYCCEYAEQEQINFRYRCDACPINWPSSRRRTPCCDRETYDDKQGLFNLWKHEKDYKRAALLAYKISKLPEKK